MRMTLKKIVEMDVPFGNPIEITTKSRKEEYSNYLNKNKHLGYYLYTSQGKDKKNKTVSIIVYQTENGQTQIEIPRIKEVRILEYKE